MLDIKTLTLLNFIVGVIGVGVVAVIWSQNRGRFAGISFWLVGIALWAAGLFLMLLRGLVPDLISMPLANTILQAGVLILFIGLERFTGKKGWQIQNYVLLAVFMAVMAYFGIVQPNLWVREIAVSAITLIFTFQCSWLLLRRVEPGMRQITRLTGIVFAVYAAFSFARIVLTIITPEQSNDFFKSGAVNALAMTGYIVISICLVSSLVLTVNRRLDADSWEAAEALRGSEAQYRLLAEHTADVVALMDMNLNVTYQSPSSEKLRGYTSRELTDLPLEKNLTPESLKLAFEVFNRELPGIEADPGYNPVTVLDLEYYRKDGTTVWLESNFSNIRDVSGKPVSILLEARDITERRLAEEKLKQSHDLITNLARLVPGVIYQYRLYPDGRSAFPYSSPGMNDIYEVTPEEVREDATAVFGRLHPDDYDRVADTIQESARTLQIFYCEFRVILPRQGLRWRWSQAHPERMVDGGTLWHGIISDITERKQAEAALRESETHYRALVDGIPGVVYSFSSKRGGVYYSSHVMNLLGYSPEQLCAQPLLWHKSIHPDDLPHIEQVIRETAEDEPFRVEYRICDALGNWHWFDDRSFSYQRDGADVIIEGLALDITERKLADEKLAKSYESVKKTLDDAINTMVKIVELRDPYTAGHQQKVADLATAIAMEMKLEDARINQLRTAALIHDIGKMYVPSDILSKPGKLSAIELDLIKTHSQSSYDIVKSMDFPGAIAQAVLQHHERLDGSGYPNQLKSADTLLEAKILAVADVVEAMSSHRPYRPALGIDKALEELSNGRGKLYEPNVVDACLELFKSGRFEFKSV